MAFANFSLTTAYATVISMINAQLTAAANLFRDQTTGDFSNQVRYSSANKRLEYWNGTAWAELDLSASTVTNASQVGGNLPSAFATSTQGTKADNALPATAYTAADVLAKMVAQSGTTNGVTVQSAGACSGNAATSTTATNASSTGNIPKLDGNGVHIFSGVITPNGTSAISVVGTGGYYTNPPVAMLRSGVGTITIVFASGLFSNPPTVHVTLSSGGTYSVLGVASSTTAGIIETFNVSAASLADLGSTYRINFTIIGN